MAKSRTEETAAANDRHGLLTFWVFVLAFVAIFLVCYPTTYAIEDEFNILSLAVTLTKGTVFLDQADIDLDADLVWNGHRISKFSPFHAALLTPAVATEWRLAFLVSAAFAVGGAFIFRGMLERERLSRGWVALYFLCPGLLFYSRTLMAAVPAAVMALAGVSLLDRDPPKPVLAGFSLASASLFHPWLIAAAASLSIGWWLEAPRRRLKEFALLGCAAAPAAASLMIYNAATTGSPFQNVYSLLGTQYAFNGEHVGTFLPFYLVSLLVMPIGGWVAFSPRWARGHAVPFTLATIVTLASLYYFRDGMSYGLAGWVPGQRFALPASLLACMPAARFLSYRAATLKLAPATATERTTAWRLARHSLLRRAQLAAVACFIAGFLALSLWHAAYLDAHATVQEAIRTIIPAGAHVLVGERAFKEFAPVNGRWTLRQMRADRIPTDDERVGSYTVWIGSPGEQPPQGWFSDPRPLRIEARSWVWSRDMWIGGPSVSE